MTQQQPSKAEGAVAGDLPWEVVGALWGEEECLVCGSEVNVRVIGSLVFS